MSRHSNSPEKTEKESSCKCVVCSPECIEGTDYCTTFDQKGKCKGCGIETTHLARYYINRLGYCEVCLF